MAIQISGTTVINNSRELGSGLVSAYDAVTASASGATVTNRTVYCVTADSQTVTLPSSPTAGNEVVIINGGEFTATVVGRNGSNIMGLAENMTLDRNYAAMTFIYIDASNGWRVC
jgi:hypothetical protein